MLKREKNIEQKPSKRPIKFDWKTVPVVQSDDERDSKVENPARPR